MRITLSTVLLVAVCLTTLGQLSQPPKAHAQSAFESVIVSDFKGLNYGNLYELENGQIWKQTEAWTWFWVWFRPRVIIYNDGMWKMKVENIDHPVTVIRLK